MVDVVPLIQLGCISLYQLASMAFRIGSYVSAIRDTVNIAMRHA